MISRRVFVALAVCLFLTSTAFAGGNGGTKKDATISVRNDQLVTIAAYVDPPAGAATATTQAQIEALGGQVILPGQTKSFKVKAGTYTLAAGSTFPGTSTSVTIGKGATKRYALTPGAALVAF